MTLLFFIVLYIILLFQIAIAYYNNRKKIALAFLLFLEFVVVSLFHLVPLCTSVILGQPELQRMNIDSNDYFFVLGLEIMSISIFNYAVLFFAKTPNLKVYVSCDYTRIFMLLGFTVFLANLLEVELFGLFTTALRRFGALISLYYLLKSPNRSLAYTLIAVALLSSEALVGSRGAIFSYLIYGLFLKRNSLSMRSLGLASGILVILLFLGPYMHAFRMITADSSVEERSLTQTELIALGESFKKRTPLEEIDFRLGINGRVSVGFLQLRRYEPAGFRIIRNTVKSVLTSEPGFFSGSLTDDYFGMGMYRIHGILENRPAVMSNFFPSTHAYWEFGLIGSIVVATFVGVVTGLFLKIVPVFRGIYIPLTMLYFDTYWQMFNHPIYELIITWFTLIIPVVFIAFCYWLLVQVTYSIFHRG